MKWIVIVTTLPLLLSANVANAQTASTGSGQGSGQSYPSKAVRLVVPFAPGGGTDLVARVLAQRLTESLGQVFVVENRGGAGGVIGADAVAKSAPDGYTLVMGTPGSMTINPNLKAKMPYDTLRDFAPISLATISPFVLTLHPSLPAKTLKEFIALAKAQPGRLNYGTSGNGSVAHLSTEYLKSLARIDLVHVAYKGSNLALTDTLSGQLQVLFDNLPVVLPHVRTDRLRAIGVGTQRRSAMIPNVPTIAESGVPAFEASTAFGVLAPAHTPPAAVNRLSQEIVRIVQLPGVKEWLASQGLEAVGSTPQQYDAHLRAELVKYARIVKSANIKAE
jgi:tripartite-type tricarboxylate transporter receptor subunit TctC